MFKCGMKGKTYGYNGGDEVVDAVFVADVYGDGEGVAG